MRQRPTIGSTETNRHEYTYTYKYVHKMGEEQCAWIHRFPVKIQIAHE